MAYVMPTVGWTIYAKRHGAPKRSFVTWNMPSALMRTSHDGSNPGLTIEVPYQFSDLFTPAGKVQIGFESYTTRLLFTGEVFHASGVPNFMRGKETTTTVIVRITEAPVRLKRKRRKQA